MNKERVKELLNEIYGCNGKRNSDSIKLFINSKYGLTRKELI